MSKFSCHVYNYLIFSRFIQIFSNLGFDLLLLIVMLHESDIVARNFLKHELMITYGVFMRKNYHTKVLMFIKLYAGANAVLCLCLHGQ